MKEPLVVFNPIGTPRSGVFEIEIPEGAQSQKIIENCLKSKSCQSGDDSILVSLELPSFGYLTIDLMNLPMSTLKLLTFSQTNDSITLENENLQVIFKENLDWGIYSLYDKTSQRFVLNSEISGNFLKPNIH